jgi:hypothetical protein
VKALEQKVAGLVFKELNADSSAVNIQNAATAGAQLDATLVKLHQVKSMYIGL